MYRYGKIQRSPSSILGPECYLNIDSDSCISICEEQDMSSVFSCPAIPDVGAVMTVLPTDIIPHLLDAVSGSPVAIMNATGLISHGFQTYHIQFRIFNKLYTTRILCIPNKNYALIGRDILNQFIVVFDAPNGLWKLVEPNDSYYTLHSENIEQSVLEPNEVNKEESSLSFIEKIKRSLDFKKS